MADTYNQRSITLRDFRITLEVLIPDFPKIQLFNCLKLMDLDGNQKIEEKEFNLLFLTEEIIAQKRNETSYSAPKIIGRIFMFENCLMNFLAKDKTLGLTK